MRVPIPQAISLGWRIGLPLGLLRPVPGPRLGPSLGPRLRQAAAGTRRCPRNPQRRSTVSSRAACAASGSLCRAAPALSAPGRPP